MITSESGKIIMDILPYYVQKNVQHYRPYTLDKILKMKIFTGYEIAYIIHSVVSYLDIVHENGLVFDGQIKAENIAVQLQSNLKVWKYCN